MNKTDDTVFEVEVRFPDGRAWTRRVHTKSVQEALRRSDELVRVIGKATAGTHNETKHWTYNAE